MIIDAHNENVALNRSTRYAIVGAGPAGMTLARELSNINSVLLIESGGFEANADVQALYTGECVGIKYPLTDTRARQFGGSSALWAGYCAIFDPHDFLQRDWVPTSGWPFARSLENRLCDIPAGVPSAKDAEANNETSPGSPAFSGGPLNDHAPRGFPE